MKTVATVCFASIAIALCATSCKPRTTAPAAAAPPSSPPPHVASINAGSSSTPAPPPASAKTRQLEMYATWYDVPPASLAARRAGVDELTAAHNHLPLGTRLRVTHPSSGRTVVVRVTDRGIPRGRVKLDLCRAAAEQLGMVSEGMARVRVEILGDDSQIAAGAPDTPASQPSR